MVGTAVFEQVDELSPPQQNTPYHGAGGRVYNGSMLSIEKISEGFAEKASAYPLRRAYLFGSQARGQAREDSDYDILLDVDEGFSLFDLCGLTNDLHDRFGVNFDVVTRSSLKDKVLKSAQADEVLIYER